MYQKDEMCDVKKYRIKSQVNTKKLTKEVHNEVMSTIMFEIEKHQNC